MLLSVAMLLALLIASRAQVFDQKNRITRGQLFRHEGLHSRRLLQGGQVTPGMVREEDQAIIELIGGFPPSCDQEYLESNEYFSKAAECYNTAGLEINVENRDAYYENPAMFSTCYKPCRDVYDVVGNSCWKDLAADVVQLSNNWAAEADQNSFPSPNEKESIDLILNSRVTEALYGIQLPTLDNLLDFSSSSVDQNTIAESFRDSAREIENSPFDSLGPFFPCVEEEVVESTEAEGGDYGDYELYGEAEEYDDYGDEEEKEEEGTAESNTSRDTPDDATVSGSTKCNFVYAALAFLAILI